VVRENEVAKVNPAGQSWKERGGNRHGKPQLRIDEARKWLDVAMRMANHSGVPSTRVRVR